MQDESERVIGDVATELATQATETAGEGSAPPPPPTAPAAAVPAGAPVPPGPAKESWWKRRSSVPVLALILFGIALLGVGFVGGHFADHHDHHRRFGRPAMFRMHEGYGPGGGAPGQFGGRVGPKRRFQVPNGGPGAPYGGAAQGQCLVVPAPGNAGGGAAPRQMPCAQIPGESGNSSSPGGQSSSGSPGSSSGGAPAPANPPTSSAP